MTCQVVCAREAETVTATSEEARSSFLFMISLTAD